MSATSTTGRAALVAANGRARRPAEPPQGELSHAEALRGRERRDCCQCENVANTQSQYPIGIGNNGTGNTSTMATFSSLPNGWEVRRLKSILRPHKILVGKRCNEYDLLSLTLRGIVKRDMENPEGKFPASFETYQEVNSGDFVFCMFDNEETPRAVGLSSLRGMITGAYDVMSLIAEGVNREFLNYYFLWVDDGKRLKPLYKGLRKTVPLDSFLAYKISLPPLPEQKAIVAYLDAETGRIDKAIAAEEKMIALLQERREIVINEAVGECCQCENVANAQSQSPIGTGNIGTGNTSTMATFACLPKGWKVRRIGWLMSIKPSISAPHEELLSVFLHKGVIRFIEENEKRTNATSTDLSKYQLVQPGDFVMNNQQAWRGSVGVSRYRGIVSPAYFVMRLADCLQPDFANYLLRSRRVVSIFERCSRGVGTIQRNLIWDMLKIYRIAYPPLPEQEAIVERLDRETGKIDRAIEVKRRQIELLRERRQIVIDEVVTGKVKVA